MRTLVHPVRDGIELTHVLHALSDPMRLAIVRALSDGLERPCCAALTTELPKSTLSNHFRVLREAGVIHSRKDGVALMNTLRREDLDARFPGLLDAILTGARGLPCG